MSTTTDQPAASVPAMTIHAALCAVMADVGAVGKDKRIEQGPAKYAYRSIEAMLARIQPAFVAHGVVCFPEVLSAEYRDGTTKSGGSTREATMHVRFTFIGPDGSSIQTVTVGEATDTSDKASNKAMTAAYKYALLLTLSIPTEMDDQDAERIERGHRDRPPAAPTVDEQAQAAGFDSEVHRVKRHKDAQAWAREHLSEIDRAPLREMFDGRWPLEARELAEWEAKAREISAAASSDGVVLSDDGTAVDTATGEVFSGEPFDDGTTENPATKAKQIAGAKRDELKAKMNEIEGKTKGATK